jgi:hypothetical protein
MVPTALWVVDRRGKQQGSTSSPSPSQARAFELAISDDGSFVGGDDSATEVVLDLLAHPAAARTVRIRAVPLEDPDYKRKHPDQYADLRSSVATYERTVNRLLRGRVHYYWKWQVSELVDAVLELRAITLPAQYNRQTWYVWPAEDAGSVVTVRLDEQSAGSVLTGHYKDEPDAGREQGIGGVPSDEPIWLKQIFPRIVWTRIVPAVLVQLDGRRDWDGAPPLDVTEWVLSDRTPDQLGRTRPDDLRPSYEPAEWAW